MSDVLQQPAASANPPKLMRKVSDIPEPHYGAWHESRFYDFNPTCADIQRAIGEKRRDIRNYQIDLQTLNDAWVQGSSFE
jgi:hypothetical protein